MTQPEGDAAAPRRTLFLDDEALGAASVERYDVATVDVATADVANGNAAIDNAATVDAAAVGVARVGEAPVGESTAAAAAKQTEQTKQVTQPDQPDPVGEFTRRERINPWLVGLWVAAAMLVIAGIGGQIYLETTTVPMIGAGYVEVLTAEGLAVVPAVVGALAPWLVCIGLASAVSATAIHSLHWYRTHAS